MDMEIYEIQESHDKIWVTCKKEMVRQFQTEEIILDLCRLYVGWNKTGKMLNNVSSKLLKHLD